ncbi:MAG: HD domain-containing protein [Bacillus sp. (in: Bacteria)]|nr:HD domain-containing protein [Bacillus sp. (in: firmicutes)]MCM1425182.1 HD domain-containing protein [Eubacterium sp.]
MDTIYQLTRRMITYEKGTPRRIQHFIKVHSFAKSIGIGEHLDAETLYTLEIAAIVHDIGILPAEKKYGSCEGKLQEQEGPAPAREMLSSLSIAPDVIDRVCYLVAHHHTYENVDDIDYRILLEADALVNLYEDNSPRSAIDAMLKNVFRTETGTRICREMFFGEIA